MEQKLLGWMTFLWSRKYMFSWLHWHGTCCHLGVLRKHLACFLTCCSILSQWSHQRALYTQKKCHQMPNFQPYTMLFALGFCNTIDHPCFAGGGAAVKMPQSHGLDVYLEPSSFTHAVPTSEATSIHTVVIMSTTTASVYYQYRCIKIFLQKHWSILRDHMVLLHVRHDLMLVKNLMLHMLYDVCLCVGHKEYIMNTVSFVIQTKGSTKPLLVIIILQGTACRWWDTKVSHVGIQPKEGDFFNDFFFPH